MDKFVFLHNNPLNMRFRPSLFFLFFFVASRCFSQNGVSNQIQLNWSVRNPFEHNVFIENKGQFTEEEKTSVGDSILFYSRKGKLFLYFTKHSIVFRYDSIYKEKEDIEDDKMKANNEENESINVKHLYYKMMWEGAASNTNVVSQNVVSDYYTYNNPNDKTGHSGIKASAYKKLIYYNLYPGIDMELYFPKEKDGFEFDYIVDSRAKPSDIKGKSDIRLNSFFGIKQNSVSDYDLNTKRSARLTIQNWDTATSLGDTNVAYDIDCDMYGNIYVYGGQDPYQLQKYNSLGKLLWTYTTGFSGGGGYNEYCGDFTVDARNGTSYICDGVDYTFGCQIAKVNTSGILTKLKVPCDSVWEMWRIRFDYCNNELVVGDGTPPYPYQACISDTNLNCTKLGNILGTTDLYHDIGLLALDQCGNSYFATVHQDSQDSLFDNDLIKAQLPNLSPIPFIKSDGYHFRELVTLFYYPSHPGFANGFNGMAANRNAVFMYDGSVLTKRNSINGGLKDSISVTKTSFQWGGLDIDCAENVYAGDRDSIIMFDSNLTRIGFAKLPNTVYALKVGYTGQVYACGNGFVCSLNALVPPAKTIATFTASTSCAGCNGTATANRTCGVSPFKYSWSNGATTQTITGLCPGTYTVIATDASNSCLLFLDTVVVTIPGEKGILITHTDTNPKCLISHGNITVYPNGGEPPYTYLWNNGISTQKDTGLIAGSYYCIVTDSSGCRDSVSITLDDPSPPTINIISYNPSTCDGCPDTILTSGAKNYSWVPSIGLSCTNCSNPVATISVTTTYTVTGTDSLGCENEKIITIVIENLCEDLKIPNVFTPNYAGQNGENNKFFINTGNITNWTINIYNRWGKEMFKSSDPLRYWNGTTESGNIVPDGIYYYVITYSCNGSNYNKQGFVEVIR